MKPTKTNIKAAAVTAVAKPVATGVIDWGNYQGESGFENVQQSDLGIPFLSIIQSKSPQFDKTHKDYPTKKIEGVEVGDIINSVTNKVLAKVDKGHILVVPATFEKTYNEYKQGRGGLVRIHRNPAVLDDVTGQTDKGEGVLSNGNILAETSNFYVLLLVEGEEPIPSIISMASTQLKNGRKWLNIMTGIRVGPNRIQPPAFSHSYKLSTVIERKDNNAWYGWNIQVNDINNDGDLVGAAQSIAKRVANATHVALAGGSAPAKLTNGTKDTDEVPM